MQLHFIYVYAFIFPEPGWSCLAATLTNTHQPFTLPTFSPFAVILFQLFFPSFSYCESHYNIFALCLNGKQSFIYAA